MSGNSMFNTNGAVPYLVEENPIVHNQSLGLPHPHVKFELFVFKNLG